MTLRYFRNPQKPNKSPNISNLLLMLIVCYCQSCGAKDPLPEMPQSTIMPLAIGNFWVFQRTYLWQDTVRYEIDKRYIFGDTITYAFTNYRDGTPSSESTLLYNDKDGLYLFGRWNKNYGLTRCHALIAPYPADIGFVWERNCIFLIPIWGYYRCIATDALAETLIGSYKSYCFMYNQGSVYDYEYYCPGIGPVKIKYTGEIWELKKVHISE